ncbi:hypothetical protein [Actinomadura sp. NPDC049753]|uniref:hypothetical protein n=1 Tax=Actinomadura sp. NPDC049753 TaxID=3154739 RepID=UPI00344805E1
MSDNEPGARDASVVLPGSRFRKLPVRIPYEEMVEEKSVNSRSQSEGAYATEASWAQFGCFIADLGL